MSSGRERDAIRCRRSLAIAARVAAGEAPTAAERDHVASCSACRRAIERAEAFPVLLRTAARSLVSEAAAVIPAPSMATHPGWHAAVAIEPRAFDALERSPWPSRGIGSWAGVRPGAAGAPARAAALVLVAVAAVALALAMGPRVLELTAGQAAAAPVDASGVLTRLLGRGYACQGELPAGPAGGSGPAYACEREVGALGQVTIDLHAATDGTLSSLVARFPGSQTPENRAAAQAELRALATTAISGTPDVNAVADWVDAFFTPARDPGSTSLRVEGLVLRLSVIPARPYELDVNPASPG